MSYINRPGTPQLKPRLVAPQYRTQPSFLSPRAQRHGVINRGVQYRQRPPYLRPPNWMIGEKTPRYR